MTGGKMVGYARVSTTDQDLSIQLAALQKAGCDTIFQEKKSGTTTMGRDELARCLEYLRDGDTLVVTKVDRLGRSLWDLAKIIDGVRKRGVKFRTLDAAFDVDTPEGQAMLGMLMVFAEMENAFRKERQRAGIEAAKARGVYKKKQNRPVGRKTTIAKEYLRRGLSYKQAAELAGMNYRTLIRSAPEFKTPKGSRKAKPDAPEGAIVVTAPTLPATSIVQEPVPTPAPVEAGFGAPPEPLKTPTKRGLLGVFLKR